ncbi:MAG: purine-nucleoside phosphorylase, partial [Chitinophagaceae bacterium]
MATDLLKQLQETVQFLQAQFAEKPTIGIVLGSGLGNFVEEIEVEKEVAYGDIPHFPISTVEGHKGRLVFGTLNGKTVVAMAGRFHFYEGYSAQQVVYPIRVMK